MHTSLVDELARVLEDLGPDADGVAATLRAEGVAGVVGCSRRCAVARALRAAGVLPAELVEDLTVGRWGVRLYRAGFGTVQVDLTDAVEEFLRRFDGGHYPDLVEDPA